MFSSSNTRAFQPFASNSVRRPVAIPRVARPHHHHHHHYHTSSFSYTDLVVSYERVITDSKDTNSAAASQQYLSDPAVHGNPKIMARQIQHTLGQVVSAGRHAVEEVAAALDPKQRSDSSSNTAKSRPKPLKAVGKQAARLGQAIAHDVHAATQEAYHHYGPHVTAAGVRLVGKGTAAAAVDVIGPTNTARAIRQLGSTNAAAATEELGVTGVPKVSRRLGPVGLAKVVAKLGLRGVLNLGAHIMSRTADAVRAQAAWLNPGHQPQADAAVDEAVAGLQDGEDTSNSSSSSSSDRHSSRSRRQGGRLPGVALVAALLQLLLLALAGVLQSMSKLLQAGVRLWDRLHRHQVEAEGDIPGDSLEHTTSLATAAAAPANSS